MLSTIKKINLHLPKLKVVAEIKQGDSFAPFKDVLEYLDRCVPILERVLDSNNLTIHRAEYLCDTDDFIIQIDGKDFYSLIKKYSQPRLVVSFDISIELRCSGDRDPVNGYSIYRLVNRL